MEVIGPHKQNLLRRNQKPSPLPHNASCCHHLGQPSVRADGQWEATCKPEERSHTVSISPAGTGAQISEKKTKHRPSNTEP